MVLIHKATLEDEVEIHGKVQLSIGREFGLPAPSFGEHTAQRQSPCSAQAGQQRRFQTKVSVALLEA